MTSSLTRNQLSTWQSFCACFCVLFSISTFTLIFYFLDRGLNFSDEGMYLYSIAHPEWLWIIGTNFAHILHPIFLALGKDIYLFRVVTFFTLTLFSLLCLISFLLLIRRRIRMPFAVWCALFFALWCSVLGYYTSWLPTASYNTLALLGVLGIIMSLIAYSLSIKPYHRAHFLAQDRARWALRILSIVGLALFGAIAFLGKPSTSAGMGIIAAVYICCTQGTRGWPKRLWDALVAGVLALLILALYIFLFHEPSVFFDKVRNGLSFFDKSHSLIHLASFYINFFFPSSYVTVFITWFLWGAVLWATHKERYSIAFLLLIATLCLWLVTSYAWTQSYTIALMLFPLGLVLCVALCLWRRSWKHVRFSLLLALLFCVSSLMYHAGTNTSLSYKNSESLILSALALVSLCLGMNTVHRAIVLPTVSLIICFATIGTLFYAFFESTRHKGITLWDMTESVEVRPDTHPLRVHPDRKVFIDWILKTAHAHNWEAGTPLINTSFDTASTLFLLDAHKADAAWQVRPHSIEGDYYKRAFSFMAPHDLQRAWIIKPVNDGARNMPQMALKEIGLDFPENYMLLSVSPTESTKGTWPAMQYEIWKPK